MARLWSSGGELQSVADDTTSTSGVSPTIETTIVRNGGASYKFVSVTSPGSSQFFTYQFQAADTNGAFYARSYIYIASGPTNDQTILAFVASGGAQRARLRLASDGTVKLWDGAGTVGSPSGALTPNTWYRMELYYFNNTGSGFAEVSGRLNGVVFASTTSSTNTGTVRDILIGASDQNDTVIYHDDIALNDSTGTDQNSWPGNGKILYLRPAGAGSSNTWLTSAGGAGSSTNWQAVDEIDPDDTTTYLKRTSTTIKVDDYTVTNPTSVGIGIGDRITLVQVGVRGGALSGTASTALDILLRLKSASGGTPVKSASSTNRMHVNGWTTNTATLPKNYQLTSYTDPTTTKAWTVTGTNSLTNMQIGMENQTSTTTEVRVSAVWALVEYVPNDTNFFSFF